MSLINGDGHRSILRGTVQRRSATWVIPFLWIIAVGGRVLSQESSVSGSIQIPRAISPPNLEQLSVSISAGSGVQITDFRQREPGDGVPVSQATSAFLSYDLQNLYVVFVCRDDPDGVRGRMSKRDDISEDDAVTVYLDTFLDGQQAYYFSVNPLGIQADGIMSPGGTDNRFDAVWDAKGRITPDGYAVSITIPFRNLRYSGATQQVWGIALGRWIVRNRESSYWPHITKRQSSFLQQFGRAEGLLDIPHGHSGQIIPYVSYTNARLLDAGVPVYRTQADPRAGVDAKLAIKTALTLDVTVNPDFSQVESDEPQVTANQRYEVFYPEKRPFFLENINKFETPLRLFFTRRIVDPEFGARLTGRIGRWNLGALASDDRAPGKTADTENRFYGERAVIGVVRLQREFLKDSNFGVLATARRFGSTDNRVYSADTRLRLSPTWYFKGQAAYSQNRSHNADLDMTHDKGRAYFGDLSYGGRHFSYGAHYQDLSAGFRAPLGFIQRVDVRKASQYAGYYFYPENSRILSFGSTASVGANWDRNGRSTDRYSNIDFRMDFAGPAGFSVSRYDAYENYLQQDYRYHANSATIYLSHIRSITFFGSYAAGTGINYSSPGTPFLGRTQNGSAGFTWRPAARIRLEQFYYNSRFRTALTSLDPGSAVFINHLARTKINFQFTKALSLREIVDYDALSPNDALYLGEHYKRVTSDILLTYLLKPGAAVYVGYNNRFENLTADPDSAPPLRRFGLPSYPTTRQFYVKLSYLLQF